MTTETAPHQGTPGTIVRAGRYCRISSDPRERRAGVDRQAEDTAALCDVKGWEAAGLYVDNDTSASSGKARPEWDRLLTDIADGKIDAIAAWDQDRGWRMMAELETLRAFFNGLGRKIPLATTGQGDVDLYTPTGVLAVQIKTAVSEHEIAMLKVRMCRAARQKAERGLPQWRNAFGYKADGSREPDPITGPLVAKMYRDLLAGASFADIAREWTAAGVKTPRGVEWTAPMIAALARKHRNAGLRSHNAKRAVARREDVVAEGNWPPLVDPATFWAVQDTLDTRTRRKPRRPVRQYLLSGLMRCGKCGGSITGCPDGDGTRRYACRNAKCRGVSLMAADGEAVVTGAVAAYLARPGAVELLTDTSLDDAEREALRAELAALHTRLDGLAQDYADGLLDGRQVKVASDGIRQKIAAAQRRQQSETQTAVFDRLAIGTPEVAAGLSALTPDRYRALVELLAVITVMPVGKGRHVFDPRRIRFDWRT
ncbi:recombinase family protein [Mycobacterium sp.]|uniref:recombinase family protein n=1 Tax=Mycobacterium sp. TaxID=1785 RepID=UPI003F982EED